ncbi:YciI family protein [Oleiagrimonas sp. MCCC 1A03011]|uniref:YciI family protein n=1 Tax=Oleiagrimonas sp. MCCC 1A03011 TaxID=1926883 RepID=UPI000DC28055|nr:YciI family protein [Oleiagrimonas sp. MCCC 1A03011]RAP56364.1 hypothetical protein BTJ49_13195 [Oleiagrimonas sp. MCCC 1A03011]
MNRYLVLTLRNPQFDPDMIDPHYAFLDRLREQGRLELAGPFGDGMGGAYLLHAGDIDEATAMAHEDPLHRSGSSTVTVREWAAK